MNWFRNLKTASKLIWSFALVSLLSALGGFVALSNLQKTNDMLGTLYKVHLIGLDRIGDANMAQLRAARDIRNIALSATREEAERHSANMETAFTELADSLAKVEPTITRAEGKAMIASIRGAIPEWQGQLRTVARLTQEGKRNEAVDGLKAAQSSGDRLREALRGLSDQKLQVGAESFEASQVLFSQSRVQLIAISLVSVVLGLILGFSIARLIGTPLQQAVQVLEAVAGRDFTQRLDVNSTDEVGQMAGALNQAVEGVQTALSEVRAVADEVATASRQLSASAEEISSGAQEQASSLEETAANLEEITSTVKQNADNAQQASQLGAGARDVAEKGGSVVNSAVQAMGEINEASKRIAEIITTIDEIAFQTNLLALNAAVEAARAGEQGRGFAVVAAEVRNLAQRSATAAKEIKGLINDSVRRVESGSQLVNQSGTQLSEIVNSVKRVTDLVAEMASASREQSSGIEQVNKAVAQMDQVTQANSAQTEELSSTAEAMNAQAEQLRGLVSQFRLGDDHVRAKPAASARRPARSTGLATRGTPARLAARPASVPRAAAAPAPKSAPNGTHQDLDAAMAAAIGSPGGGAHGGKDEFEDV